MSLTPLTRDSNSQSTFPVHISWSALIESAATSTGRVSDQCTIALGFKPTAATKAPLIDMGGHYLLTIRKQGDVVTIWKQGIELTPLSASDFPTTSYAAFLQGILTAVCGSYCGYYSRLIVVDGAAYDYNKFWAPSSSLAAVWAPRSMNLPRFIQETNVAPIDGTATVVNLSGSTDNLFNSTLHDVYPNAGSASQVSSVQVIKEWSHPKCITRLGIHASSSYPWCGGTTTFYFEGRNADGAWEILGQGSTLLAANGSFYIPYEGTTKYAAHRLRDVSDTIRDRQPGQVEFYEKSSTRYGLNGGVYDLSDASDLGKDSGEYNNHWAISGTQSDDTPTDNATTRSYNQPSPSDNTLLIDGVLRVGTATAQSFTLSMGSPDLIISKDRDSSSRMTWFDTARGNDNVMFTSDMDAQHAMEGSISMTDSGYTVGNNAGVNKNGNRFLDLCLKKQPGMFDMVYPIAMTGNDVTFPHALGVRPSVVILKNVSRAGHWYMWHSALDDGTQFRLDEMAPAVSVPNWCSTTATNVTINGSIGTVGDEYIAYLFAACDWIKPFSYTGNGDPNGPTIDLGGRPLLVTFIKNPTVTEVWPWYDTLRDNENPVANYLFMNPNQIEAGDQATASYGGRSLHFLSTGFQVVGLDPSVNGSGATIVGLAFLETTKYGNAF